MREAHRPPADPDGRAMGQFVAAPICTTSPVLLHCLLTNHYPQYPQTGSMGRILVKQPVESTILIYPHFPSLVRRSHLE